MTDTEPLVIDTTVEGVIMVESRAHCPGAMWPVQAVNGAYRCPCPAGRRRGGCAHTRAAWRHHPLITAVPEPDPDAGSDEWWDRQEARQYLGRG